MTTPSIEDQPTSYTLEEALDKIMQQDAELAEREGDINDLAEQLEIAIDFRTNIVNRMVGILAFTRPLIALLMSQQKGHEVEYPLGSVDTIDKLEGSNPNGKRLIFWAEKCEPGTEMQAKAGIAYKNDQEAVGDIDCGSKWDVEKRDIFRLPANAMEFQNLYDGLRDAYNAEGFEKEAARVYNEAQEAEKQEEEQS